MGEVIHWPVFHGPSSAAVSFPSASILLARNNANFTSALCVLSLLESCKLSFARRGQHQRRKATRCIGLLPWQRLKRKTGTKDSMSGVYSEWTQVAKEWNDRLRATPVNNLCVEDEESKANDRSLLYTEHYSTKCTWLGIHISCLSIHKYTAQLIN